MRVEAGGGPLERVPERLVVEGFRHWPAGQARSGDLSHWEAAWSLYAKALGPRQARPVMDRLVRWVKAVRQCAACPIRHLPDGRAMQCDNCSDVERSVSFTSADIQRKSSRVEAPYNALGGRRGA